MHVCTWVMEGKQVHEEIFFFYLKPLTTQIQMLKETLTY